jgi:hypothetical protein
MLSGRAIDNDDPLSRRDQGLEFLDVTEKVEAQRLGSGSDSAPNEDVWQLTNTSGDIIDTHLLVIVRDLPAGVRLLNDGGTTSDGDPFLRVFLRDGVLNPGESITRKLVFSPTPARRRPTYTLSLLSGQGTP